MRKKTYNIREVKQIIRDNGYRFDRQTGSHEIYKNDEGDSITIKSTKCNKMIFQRLVKEHNLQI